MAVSPLLRTQAASSGCAGGPLVSGRRLRLETTFGGTETWILPPNRNTAFDFRGRHEVPPEIPLSLDDAATAGVYRLAWAGDASSILVAIEMGTVGGTSYDFSDYDTGRVGPSIDDALAMAAGNRKAKRGSYLKYSWRSVVDINSFADQLGAIPPQTVSRAASLAQCNDFNGLTFLLEPPSYGSYGDVIGPLVTPNADTFGYLRLYDIGSCSAATPFRGFAEGVTNELSTVIKTTQPGLGLVELRFDDAKVIVLPALANDVPTGLRPDQPGAIPVRTVGPDAVDMWFKGSGLATTSKAECTFDVTF